MFSEKKNLVIIPARGGSKRLPRKNILPLSGKPLICWTIEAALNAKLNGQIIVTSDDEEILSVVRQYESDGVIAYKRPNELATDSVTTSDVIKDVCSFSESIHFKPTTIVLLQPTSPLRTSVDIRAAVDLYYQKHNQDTVVSVCEVDHPTAWTGTVNKDGVISGIDFTGKRSQEYTKEYRLNGAIYVENYDYFVNTDGLFTDNVYAYMMPKERSVDIDDQFDFDLAELSFSVIGGFKNEI